MALYALDEESNLVFAPTANSSQKYRCLECRGLVQRRAGLHKRAHFCHLIRAPQCRLHSRSIDHLVLQTRLKEAIPELEMERPFPSLLRIADLAWEKQKIVFEIQCSLIGPAEAEKRRKDYAQEGYLLVWLLDDRLFNKRKLRIAEEVLRKEACYFISLGKALVYDQYELISAGERLMKGPPLPTDLSKPLNIPPSLPPLYLLKERSILFRGDLLDRLIQNSVYLQRLIEYERSFLERPSKPYWHYLKKGLQMGFEYLLRKTAEQERL